MKKIVLALVISSVLSGCSTEPVAPKVPLSEQIRLATPEDACKILGENSSNIDDYIAIRKALALRVSQNNFDISPEFCNEIALLAKRDKQNRIIRDDQSYRGIQNFSRAMALQGLCIANGTC